MLAVLGMHLPDAPGLVSEQESQRLIEQSRRLLLFGKADV
jgi:hypothetical protein